MKTDMTGRGGFASDNNAGVHPDVMHALAAVNTGHVPAYGDDPYTEAATRQFRAHFGAETAVYFVFGGTGANVLALQALVAPYHAIVCAATAHINVDECGAPEHFTGCKLLPVDTPDGKLTVAQVAALLGDVGDQHRAQPKVISISEATEKGTVYTPAEVTALAEFAHGHDLYLHMDGARLANAAAHLAVPLRALTTDAGVDVLSFGGTKNGMMYGEAVVFCRTELARDFHYVRKQGLHLASKMRFIAAQFAALLTDDLWSRNAAHANRMARLLADGLGRIAQIRLTQPVESNAVFAHIPRAYIPVIQQEYFFHVWDEQASEVRLMTSFDTTAEDVESFSALVERIVK